MLQIATKHHFNIYFFIFLKTFTGLVSLLIAALAFCIIFCISVDLSFLKPGVKKAAQSALSGEVKITGSPLVQYIETPEEIPADGKDACLQAWRYTGKPQSVNQSTEVKTVKKFQEVKKETQSKPGSNLDILNTD